MLKTSEQSVHTQETVGSTSQFLEVVYFSFTNNVHWGASHSTAEAMFSAEHAVFTFKSLVIMLACWFLNSPCVVLSVITLTRHRGRWESAAVTQGDSDTGGAPFGLRFIYTRQRGEVRERTEPRRESRTAEDRKVCRYIRQWLALFVPKKQSPVAKWRAEPQGRSHETFSTRNVRPLNKSSVSAGMSKPSVVCRFSIMVVDIWETNVKCLVDRFWGIAMWNVLFVVIKMLNGKQFKKSI